MICAISNSVVGRVVTRIQLASFWSMMFWKQRRRTLTFRLCIKSWLFLLKLDRKVICKISMAVCAVGLYPHFAEMFSRLVRLQGSKKWCHISSMAEHAARASMLKERAELFHLLIAELPIQAAGQLPVNDYPLISLQLITRMMIVFGLWI